MVAHAQRLGLDDADVAIDSSNAALIDVADETDFPALPSSKPVSRTPAPHATPHAATSPPASSRIPLFTPPSSPFAAPLPRHVDTSTLAAKLAIQSLHASFPLVSREEIEQYYIRAGGSLDSTRSLIQSSTGHIPARIPTGNKVSPKPVAPPLPASKERREVR